MEKMQMRIYYQAILEVVNAWKSGDIVLKSEFYFSKLF